MTVEFVQPVRHRHVEVLLKVAGRDPCAVAVADQVDSRASDAFDLELDAGKARQGKSSHI